MLLPSWYPGIHRRKLRTTNSVEGINEEIMAESNLSGVSVDIEELLELVKSKDWDADSPRRALWAIRLELQCWLNLLKTLESCSPP